MRALALLALLSACTLTLEPAPGPIAGLSTQATYCQDRPTRLDYRLFLEGRVDRLAFFWVPEGVHPSQARPEETFLLEGPFPSEMGGYVEVAPTGEIRAVYLSLQGIRVDPLPTRRLWVRGVADGLPGPYLPARDPVRPEASSSCDPGW